MLYWNIPYPPEIAPIRMPDRVLAISVSAMCNILDIKETMSIFQLQCVHTHYSHAQTLLLHL